MSTVCLWRKRKPPDVLGKIVPCVGAKCDQSEKAMGFAVEALEFELVCVCLTKSEESRKDWKGAITHVLVPIYTNKYKQL